MRGIQILNKTHQEVIAELDAALFHYAKGNNANGKPYGIIESRHADPFAISFDGLVAYIAPGIMAIYGRQVELTEKTAVYDFHSTVESAKMFCTVYMEISLEDAAAQTATLKLDISGAAYKDFDATGTQDNLVSLTHGIYQAPIARFAYEPELASPFSDAEVIMPMYPSEARASTQNLRMEDKVALKALGNLAVYEDGKFKWRRASNADALANYEKASSKSESTPGYSVAEEANAFGIGENANVIDSGLSKLYMAKRETLGVITANNFRPICMMGNFVSVDADRLVAARLYVKRANPAKPALQATIKYTTKGTLPTTVYPIASIVGNSLVCSGTETDYWLTASDLENIEFDIYGRFWVTVVGPSYRGNAELILAKGPITENTTFIEALPAYDRRKLYLTAKGVLSGNYFQFSFEGQNPYMGVTYASLGGYSWTYASPEIEEIDMAIMADFIYKGDVQL